jgi:hypothetical protein
MSQQQMSEEALMKAAVFDRMDFEHDPDTGHIIVVAKHAGVTVCWECGDPFNPAIPKLALCQKKPFDSSVPVGVHYKCFNVVKSTASSSRGVTKVAAGLNAKRVAVRALAFADHLAGIAKGSAKKIIT